MLETVNQTADYLAQLTEINGIAVLALAMFVASFVDIFKLLKPSYKQYSIIAVWIVSVILAVLLLIGGQTGAIILGVAIVAGLFAKTASGDYAQTKAVKKSTDDYEPEQLPAELPE